LVELGYLGEEEAAILLRKRVMTIGYILKNGHGPSKNLGKRKSRSKILEKAGI
jgi:hypothetical protein